MTAYDRDFHAWAFAQAEALRRRSANEVDWDNVAEEIESLGKSELSQLESRLDVLVAHLLKWIYQPERRGRSWEGTIREQRRRLAKHISRNPSLRPMTHEAFVDAYESAVDELSGLLDRDVSTFPAQPPFSYEEAVDPAWMPVEITPEPPPR